MKCKLCKALEKEKDKYLYEDDDIVVLPTKNLKGHNKRIMAISKEHVKNPSHLDEDEWILIFIQFCKGYFDEEPTFALCESTYATIPNHWHKIACDWKGNEDIKQLHFTPHRAINTYVRWNPDEDRNK